MRPVFARVVRELRQQIPKPNVQGPMKQNASPGEQSEAPRPRWKPGQEQHPGPKNQDSQHILNQPRGSFLIEHSKILDVASTVSFFVEYNVRKQNFHTLGMA